MATPNPSKGARYLASLDQALCNGSWGEIQELARKTDKHAPERKCLTLTARSEANLASSSAARATSATSTTTAGRRDLDELLQPLKNAIAGSAQYPDDAYCAKVCLAHVYWLQDDYDAALEVLPSVGPHSSKESGKNGPLGWMEVCEVKAGYVRAACFEGKGDISKARHIYNDIATKTPGSRTPELRKWTERMLAVACINLKQVVDHSASDRSPVEDICRSLIAFRAWADFWQRGPSPGSTVKSQVDIPRRRVWRAYYELLSNILQHGFITGHSHSSPTTNLLIQSHAASTMDRESLSAARKAQMREVKTVESTYETMLLNETQFPKANRSNAEVESFCALAFTNFCDFASPNFPPGIFSDPGKQALGQGMLDILFRAATKTFHSTAILRMLFYTHAWRGEFDLAIAAFDSYFNIVGKGRARAEKTGVHESGFDDDDTAVRTSAEALRLLVKFGDREQAEKATQISANIEKWLKQLRPLPSAAQSAGGVRTRAERSASVSSARRMQEDSLRDAYTAMGIAAAHWARLTWSSADRPSFRQEAIEHLQRAGTYGKPSTDLTYALAVVQVESCSVGAAIKTLQSALTTADPEDEDEPDPLQSPAQRQKLLPLWHLLALCLSSRDEYEAASDICESTLEAQLASEQSIASMEADEREQALQIYLTQVSLTEAMHGVDEAVASSNEALALYARLFGSPAKMTQPTNPPQAAAVASLPPRSRGTLRSIAGSIAGRSRSRPRSVDGSTFRGGSVASGPGASFRSSAEVLPNSAPTVNGNGTSGAPIAITVTNEEGRPHHEHHHLHLPFRHHDHDNPRSRSADSRRSRNSSRGRRRTSPPPPMPNTTESVDHARPVSTVAETSQSDAQPAQPLKAVEHNVENEKLPPPPGHNDQPPEQDVRLPAPEPGSGTSPRLPQYSSLMQRRHSVSTLIGLWLFIAGLYLRTDSADNAIAAVDEANKLVDFLEAEVFESVEGMNARRLYLKGWGLGKSIELLWADVCCARGAIAASKGQPFRAMDSYEQALLHYPDHAAAIIGVAELSMDIYDQKLPPEEPSPLLEPIPAISESNADFTASSASQQSSYSASEDTTMPNGDASEENSLKRPRGGEKDPTPEELNRLACRDRAYMLLSNLTKLGTGWDNCEAWLSLARAHELSGEVQKAKSALWWVVELEQHRGVRDLRDALPSIAL